MSEETTQDMPGRQPTLAEIKEAVNSVSVELHQFREEIREEIRDFRATVENRLDDIDERINVLSGDMVRIRAGEARRKRLAETQLNSGKAEPEGEGKRT